MTLNDRVERLEQITKTQTDILESIVNALTNDNRIDNIVEAIKKQTEISNTLYEMIKAKS